MVDSGIATLIGQLQALTRSVEACSAMVKSLPLVEELVAFWKILVVEGSIVVVAMDHNY